MSCRPPFIAPRALARFLKAYFPFKSVEEQSIKLLDGYDDRNYKFQGNLKNDVSLFSNSTGKKLANDSNSSSNQFILKFLNSRDSADVKVAEGLTKLTRFLYERNFSCPYPVPSSTGSDMTIIKHSELLHEYADECMNGGEQPSAPDTSVMTPGPKDEHYCVRVFVYVEGELLGYQQHSQELLWDFGSYVGRMNKEMRAFSNAALESRNFMEWDLKELPSRREILPFGIKDPVKMELLKSVLDDFEQHVVPIVHSIEYGCIHNDLNCLNILTRKTVTSDQSKKFISGVIDFSDCVFCPYVFELGITLAYLMTRQENPVEYVKPFVQGYLSEFSLSRESLNVLYHVIVGRLAQSFINSAYGSQLDPANREYILIDAQPCWELLNILCKEGKKKCYNTWNICIDEL